MHAYAITDGIPHSTGSPSGGSNVSETLLKQLRNVSKLALSSFQSVLKAIYQGLRQDSLYTSSMQAETSSAQNPSGTCQHEGDPWLRRHLPQQGCTMLLMHCTRCLKAYADAACCRRPQCPRSCAAFHATLTQEVCVCECVPACRPSSPPATHAS